MGELFPTHVKANGAAITTCFCSTVAFITANLFPDLVNMIGMDSVFGLFSLVCICAVAFVVYLVPDTNGLSLAEIQELLNSSTSQKPLKQNTNAKIHINHLTEII